MFSTNCAACETPFAGQTKKYHCSGCHWVAYCSKQCQTKHWKEHKTECAEDLVSPEATIKKGVKKEILERFGDFGPETVEYLTDVHTKAYKMKVKAATKHTSSEQAYGADHALTLEAEEKHAQACEKLRKLNLDSHKDILMKVFPQCSDPELRAITTREQMEKFLSFVDMRKGVIDEEVLANAAAAMKLAEETGGPAARTPKKPEETGTRCQFCDKLVLLRLWCPKCKQAFYCDKECQGKDWKKHKKTCNAPADAK